MSSRFRPPTSSGQASGEEPGTGLAWAFEPPEEHWRWHDVRLVRHWLSRPVEERLAQAAWYRVRVHGIVAPPARWVWRLLPPGEF